MPRWLRFLVVGIALLSLSSTGLAQNAATWEAWLYNPGNGEMTLVDGNGFVKGTAAIPLPRGYSFFPYNVTVAASGTRVAYIANNDTAQELIVYDPRPGIRDVLLEFPLPSIYADGINFISGDALLFHPGETALTVGYSLKEGGWQIPIIDLRSRTATVILRGGAGIAQGLPVDVGITPVVRLYNGQIVVFTLLQAADVGKAEAVQGTYVWDIANNALQPTDAFTALDADYFAPTGEVVQAVFTSETGGVLEVYTPESNATREFQAADNERFFFPRFVQNGAALLAGVYDAQGIPSFKLFGRDGNLYGEFGQDIDGVLGSVRGTADGFAYTVDNVNADTTNATTLYGVNLFEGVDSSKALFTATVNTRPRIVWLHDPRLARGQYVAWGFAEETTSTPNAPTDFTGIDDWQAWIYQADGIAIRIDRDGVNLDVAALPAPDSIPAEDEAPPMPPTRITVSADGDLLAYVVVAGTQSYLQVYDTRAETVRLTYRIPTQATGALGAHTIERAPYQTLFNAKNAAIAFGSSTGTGWQVVILDAANGDGIATLAAEMLADVGITSEPGTVPVIQRHHGTQVAITLQAPGEFVPPYPAFIWDYAAETIAPTQIYANPYNDDFAPTGDVIMAMPDARLPNTADRFLYGQVNALHVYDPVGTTRYPFYNSEELWLNRPVFIQNGERILVSSVDPRGAFVGWVVIERDGELAGLLPFNEDILDVGGTANGFIYLPRGDDSVVTLRYVDTRQQLDIGRDIWRAPRTGRPQIAWVSYPTEKVTVRPWRILAVPTLVTGEAQSIRAAQLRVGGSASVQTQPGEALFVRAAPANDGDIITRLNAGTKITLLEGARVVDGIRWWRIRTPGGAEGWVAEEVGGLKMLIPET